MDAKAKKGIGVDLRTGQGISFSGNATLACAIAPFASLLLETGLVLLNSFLQAATVWWSVQQYAIQYAIECWEYSRIGH